MTRSTITRDRIEQYANDPRMCNINDEIREMARMALAALDSEPVMFCSEETLAAARDGEHLLRTLSSPSGECVIPLYRHAQQPVVPDESYQQLSDLYHAQEKRLFKIAQRIKGPAFDKYSHSPSQAIDVLEAAIFGEDDASRAAMLQAGDTVRDLSTPVDPQVAEYEQNVLQAGNSPVIPGWIPVSERMPENKPGCYKYLVFETLNNRVNHDYWNVPDKGDEAFTPFWNHYCEHVTHWMPLPAAPQERSVNDVTTGKPLTITLPDISSKAFWSGAGKNETFHPETYRRWVKEAVERACIIASIDVEVK